jgi:putative acetyltransferase
MDHLEIRPLRDDDGEAAALIFFDAVHKGAAAHYTTEQLIAWAGDRPNPSGWTNRLVGVEGYIAEVAGRPIGFMTIDAKGYVDLAFVSSDVSGRGVGWRLYVAVQERAEMLGVTFLTTDASKAARPFFERQGWVVDEEQIVERRGVPFTNFKMSKSLQAI